MLVLALGRTPATEGEAVSSGCFQEAAAGGGVGDVLLSRVLWAQRLEGEFPGPLESRWAERRAGSDSRRSGKGSGLSFLE